MNLKVDRMKNNAAHMQRRRSNSIPILISTESLDSNRKAESLLDLRRSSDVVIAKTAGSYLAALNSDLGKKNAEGKQSKISFFKRIKSKRDNRRKKREYLSRSVDDLYDAISRPLSFKGKVTPVGPSAKTWSIPKSTKKVPTAGHVFGTCVTRSGGYIVSVLTSNSEWYLHFYDKEGNLQSSQPARRQKGTKFFEIYDIAERKDSKIVAASRSSVTEWSLEDGTLANEHGKNMFKFAKMLCVRSTGEIVVSDTDDNAIKIISANQQQITKLDCLFQCPLGITVDSNDNIIVADWDSQIKIFDDCNQILRTFGAKGNRENEFDCPYGLAVDCEDNIIVADMWNNRISLFSFEGQFIRYLGYDTSRPAYVSVSTNNELNLNRMVFTDFSGETLKVYEF